MSSRVVVVSRYNELIKIKKQWGELAEKALEKNAFYEPCMFLPALKCLGISGVTIILIWKQNELIGFFPVIRERKWRDMPLRHLRLWRHKYCYLTTPLVHKNFAEESVARFQEWVVNNTSFPYMVESEMLSGSSAFFKILKQASLLTGSHIHIASQYDRAYFDTAFSFEVFLKSKSKNTVKNYRRKISQLKAKGELSFERLLSCNDVEAWADEFLSIEAGGWKGRNNSAISCNSGDKRFFHEMCQLAFKEQKLLFFRLCLNDRTLSSNCSISTGDTAFAFRTAYDESFRQYSPGWLLELEFIRFLLDEQSKIVRMDSCAAPDASLYSSIDDSKKSIVTLSTMKSTTFEHALKCHFAIKTTGRMLTSLFDSN